MDNPEKLATRRGYQEWTIQRNWPHEGAIKNGQSRDTGNTTLAIKKGQSRRGNQEWTIKNGQSRMDNQEGAIKKGQSRMDNQEEAIKNGQSRRGD